jgi:protein gp37
MVPLATAWAGGAWPENVWALTSVEDQKAANERIPRLLRVPARVRGLSCEPLLGPLDLDHYLIDDWTRIGNDVHYHEHPALHWIIAGGESGASARPMHPQWARSLRDQAQAARVNFFFKQWGEWGPWPDAVPFNERVEVFQWPTTFHDGEHWKTRYEPHYRVGKAHAGRLLDGIEWNEVPEPLIAVAREECG